MEFRTLGELEVWHADSPIPIQGAVQRSVLALLLLRANDVVRLDDLVEELWGPAAPHTAPKMIQNAVSKLRKSGMAEVLATRAGGYILQIDPEQVDATRFERLVERARAYLRDEVGLEPSPALQRLEQAILLQDSALDLEFLEAAAEPRAVRKTLTVLHADLLRQGRELDPEALLGMSARVQGCVGAA